MTSFSQCSSAKDLQKQAPLTFGDVYCQAWSGGVEAAGTGIDIYIPASKSDGVQLDSVYFRGKATKLEEKAFNGTVTYIGRFKSKPNASKDIIMSSDSKEEYKNTVEVLEKIPFDLKDNECVVSYMENEAIKYFKIENVIEKPRVNYPSARPNKQ